MAQYPLMPKSTAVWLIDNTTLTFDQIGAFCGLHPLEIQAIADGEVSANIVGTDPVKNGELEQTELDKAIKDSAYRMKIAKTDLPKPKKRTSGPRYTPVAKRGDKPDAIAYLLKQFPELTDAQIVRLIGTTKNTIDSIRSKTHANSATIKPRNPVELGLCSQEDIDRAAKRKKRDASDEAEAQSA